MAFVTYRQQGFGFAAEAIAVASSVVSGLVGGKPTVKGYPAELNGLPLGVKEYVSFTLAKPTLVAYGRQDGSTQKVLPAGTHTCGNSLFGGDPRKGAEKACYWNPNAPPAASIMASATPAGVLPTASPYGYGAPSPLGGISPVALGLGAVALVLLLQRRR